MNTAGIGRSPTVTIRDATAADVPALADLHVRTFNETHLRPGDVGPTVAVRVQQWRQAFATADGRWFCLVIEDQHGRLIGFARGQPYASADQPEFAGELNKIYLLRAWHRQGLGKRLIGQVARRLLAQGIGSMLLFGEAENPTNRVYEALGAERLYAKTGEFHGSYGWRDLQALVARCPAD